MHMKVNVTKEEKELEKTKNPICGIIMPISPIDNCSKEHWTQVKDILSEAIKSANFTPCLVSDADDSGVIQKRIVQNIYDNDIIVCDVSCKNPNVMFELGMRLAFDKPTIIVMDNNTNYSFDTSVIEHLTYPRNLSYYEILDFQKKLTGKITATINKSKDDPNYTTFLKHFGEFEVAHIEKKKGTIDQAIYSKIDDLYIQISKIQKDISSISLKPQPYEYEKDITNSIIKDEIQKYCIKNDINDKITIITDSNKYNSLVKIITEQLLKHNIKNDRKTINEYIFDELVRQI